MQTLKEIKYWIEQIFIFILPFVFTIWAWGWAWLFSTFLLILVTAIIFGQEKLHDNISYGGTLLFLLVPTLALKYICAPYPKLILLPYIYLLICALLALRKQCLVLPPKAQNKSKVTGGKNAQ